MSEDSEQELDWIHMPPGSEVESLWDCLHDGELVSSHSDLINRAVSLEFIVHHLQNGMLALKISGSLDGERFNDLYCSIFLRGTSISASRSDGEPFTLEQFIEMGRRYWEKYSSVTKGSLPGTITQQQDVANAHPHALYLEWPRALVIRRLGGSRLLE